MPTETPVDAAAAAAETPPPATAIPAPPSATDEPRRRVEQRVVGNDLRSRRYDGDGEEDEDPELRLLEVLPGEMVDGVPFPLPYRLATPTGYAGITMRLAESAPARASQYACIPFYKPISRCVGGRG